MRNKNLKAYEKKLLQGMGFTPKKAFKIVLFSMMFSSLGLSFFAFCLDYSFYQATNDVKKRIVDTLKGVSSLYSENDDAKDYVIKKEPSNFKNLKDLGPRDLDLNRAKKLVEVSGQKRKVTENYSEIRFVEKTSKNIQSKETHQNKLIK